MKRIFMMLSVLALVFLLTGCFESEEVEDALEIFCEDNPDALVCTDPTAARSEIVANMFNTMMIEFMDGTNDDFCDDYFSATNSDLLDACKNDRFSLVPEDVADLSDDVVITAGDGTNEFLVTTTYEDLSTGYIFTVTIVEEDGVIRFSEFSYEYDVDIDDDLYLGDEFIKQFMLDVINESDDDETDYCSSYFTGDALTDCNNDIGSVVHSVFVMYHPILTEIGTNTFTYTVDSFDRLEIITYTIEFVEVDEEIYISDINYVDESIYNSIENAEDVLQDFINDFTGGDLIVDLCDTFIDGADNIDECIDTFSAQFNTTVTITNIVEDRTGIYHATVEFFRTETTTVVFELYIVIGDSGIYKMNLQVISSDTTEVPVGLLTIEEVEALLRDYARDYNLHDTYDDETFCEMYVAEDSFEFIHFQCADARKDDKFDLVYLEFIGVGITNVSNNYLFTVLKHGPNETLLVEYDVIFHEGGLGHIGFTYDGYKTIDETSNIPGMNQRILEKFERFMTDYSGDVLSDEVVFDKYIYSGFDEDFFNTQRDTYNSVITSITIDNVVIVSIKDSYYIVRVEGVIDYVDSNTPNEDYSFTNRVYMDDGDIRLFYLERHLSDELDAYNASVDEIELLVSSAYEYHYDSSINCDYYFYDETLNNSCKTSPEDIFGSETIIDIEVIHHEENQFIVTRYYYNESSELSTLPDLYVNVLLVRGVLRVDEWFELEELTNDVKHQLVSDYVDLLFNDTITNADYCVEYGIDEDCDALRTELFAAGHIGWVHETVIVDGVEVEQLVLSYTVDGIEKQVVYNLDIVPDNTGEYVIGETEDALVQEAMTLEEARIIFDQFVLDYNNSSITNEQLKDKYFALTLISEEFFTERDIYLSNFDVMVKLSLDTVVGELYYSFYYNIGPDHFTNLVNVFEVADDVYNLGFLDYVPAISPVPDLAEASIIMDQYFTEYADLTISDSDLCDKYYEGAVDCLIDRELIVNGNSIILSTVYETTTGEVDHFTVVYLLNSFMEDKVVTWDITILVNPDGTYVFEEINKVTTVTPSYMLPNVAPFDTSEVNDYLTSYFDDYYNNLLTSAYVCGLYTSFEYASPGATQTPYEMCIMERDAELSSLYYEDLVSIIYDYSMYNYFDDLYIHTFYVIIEGVTDNSLLDESLLTVRYLWIEETSDAPLGYYMFSYNNNDEVLGYNDTATYETVASEILDIYLDETLTTTEVCNDFGSIIPGNNCLVDRATHVGVSTYVSHYVTYNMGYDRELIVEINISFIDSLGEVVVITLPMVITETYNSSTIAYEITDYSYYIVPDDLITKDEFNTLVNDFFTDYTNPGVTEQFIMDTYFLSGQYYLDRTNDLPDFNNHSVVETELSHLASYGSNYHIIVRAGVEGSYSYYTYFINVTVDSNGDFYLQCEYPEILN